MKDGSAAGFAGSWHLIRERSSDIGRFASLKVTTTVSSGPEGVQVLRVKRRWGQGGFAHEDVRKLVLDGAPREYEVTDPVAPESVMMNLRYARGSAALVTATFAASPAAVEIRETVPVVTSQGIGRITMDHRLELGPEHDVLIWTIRRSTRADAPPLHYLLKRSGVKEALFMELDDDWSVDGTLDEKAMLLSLQGVANRDEPRLYFVFPENWDFRFTPSVRSFLADRRNYTFTRVGRIEAALERLAPFVDGYVVWDTEVRSSLMVAFTAAGLSSCVVVSERLIPYPESAGLALVDDLRGRYCGMDDAAIFADAGKRYWQRCNKDYAVWLGGEGHRTMKPGVADWGIANRCFFTDLSTDPEDYAPGARQNPLCVGSDHELGVAHSGHNGVLLHTGYAQRLLPRDPLGSRLYVSESRALREAPAAHRESRRAHEEARPPRLRGHGLLGRLFPPRQCRPARIDSRRVLCRHA